MIEYTTAQKAIFATGRLPDGYFGATVQCDFALVGPRVVAVHPFGCHTLGLPDATDTTEALWLLRNHPTSRAQHVFEKTGDGPYIG